MERPARVPGRPPPLPDCQQPCKRDSGKNRHDNYDEESGAQPRLTLLNEPLARELLTPWVS